MNYRIPIDPWKFLGPERMVAWDRDVAADYHDQIQSAVELRCYRHQYALRNEAEIILRGVRDSRPDGPLDLTFEYVGDRWILWRIAPL